MRDLGRGHRNCLRNTCVSANTTNAIRQRFLPQRAVHPIRLPRSHVSPPRFLKVLFILVLITADDPSHLGRLDYTSFSTQALMEIFIQGIENREVICGSADEPEDIDKWRGFEYSQEQPVDGVVRHFTIDWDALDLVGTIDLQWLPPTVRSLGAIKNKLSGSLDLTKLPPSIKSLTLGFNKFSGEIELLCLPAGIEMLSVAHNQLSGSLNLEALPSSIKGLYVSGNRFTGTVCLLTLPQELANLYLGKNELSGTVDLTCLPATMTELDLNQNNFEGKTDFSQLPEDLRLLDVSYTNLSGKIVVQNRATRFLVGHSKIQLIE